MKKVFVCNDNLTSIYSAVYDAWKDCRNDEVGIVFRENMEHQLFCEYYEVNAEDKKAEAVVRMIIKNLGHNSYYHMYHALLSKDNAKAEAVFRVLQEARSISNSKKIMEHLSNPYVAKVFELSRAVQNETHMYIEVIRFRELENGILFSEITPKNHILASLGDHFANRFPLENWMIYDKTYKEFLVHKMRHDCVLVTGEEINWDAAVRIT